MQKKVSVSASDLVPLVQHGLCVYNKDGFRFTKDDTFDDLNSMFNSLFKNVYNFFDNHGYDFRSKRLSDWLICTKASGHGRGVVVFSDDSHFPNGHDIFTATQVGKAKSDFNEGILFLGTSLILIFSIDFYVYSMCFYSYT